MRQRRKESLILLIIILVLSLGIGYAFLTTTLNIDGVADVDSNTWNIYWDNLTVLEDISVTEDQVITPPTINPEKNTISFRVKLKEPSDQYFITADAVNAGSIPAQIEKINYYPTEGDYPYLGAIAFDSNTHEELQEGEIILPGREKSVTFGVIYSKNINPEDLPDTDTTVTFSVEIVFSQAPGTVKMLYSGLTPPYNITQSYTDTTGNNIIPPFTTFNTYQEALDTMEGNNFFLRYYAIDDKVYEYSIGFKYNDNIYYLIGGDGGLSFERNKKLLISLFGSDACETQDNYFICNKNDYVYRLYKAGYNYGRIEVSSQLGYACKIEGADFYNRLIYRCNDNKT